MTQMEEHDENLDWDGPLEKKNNNTDPISSWYPSKQMGNLSDSVSIVVHLDSHY